MISISLAALDYLNPGPYRFHLMASNSDGLWNGAEATLSFEIEPLLWQTWWFRLFCALACIFMLAAFYRFRLHRLTRQLNVRFEERLAERTRIAQELHDTLLQGFLSASMQLHVAADPQVLQSGREGHWGLQGMRERAERVGARFKVRSRAVNGTEVELSVPRQVAFQTRSFTHPLKWPLSWFARLSLQKVRSETADTDKRGS